MINNFYISLTGMSAFSNQIAVASNNISNMETTGFKSSSVNFSDLLAASISRTTSDNSGCGVRIQSISENWTQGSIASASSSTALAINGWGMFVVQDTGTDETYYTRDGNFQFDKLGRLVYGDYTVMGYALDEDGNPGSLTEIAVSYANAPPNPTTSLSTTVNLDSGAEDGDTFETTSTIYDSLGNEIPLTITYTKSATANEWTWAAEIPSKYGSVSSGGSGALTFDANGALTSGADPALTLTLTNGAASQSITWDLYDSAGASNGNLTQYAGDSVLTAQDQDGYSQGELTSVEIDSSGCVVCTYSNGATRTPFQIALADFTNYNGLNKTDGNLYTATRASGQAIMGVPDSGKMGSITPSSLEGSNVDLSTQMAQLITSQTAYQACARSFSVTNEMMEVLVNLK
jgi:flagellar hook protein FlgE